MSPKKRTTSTSTTTTPMTNAQIKALIAQGVADALAERNADISRNGDDNHDSGTGVRRQAPLARECTHTDFLKCQPLNFKGTKGDVRLTQSFEKMESVFHISNCTVACQIKFATCTLQGNALTWWNSHLKTVTHEVAYAMPWKTFKMMMTDKYCPRGKIKKLEIEMWNLKVKESDEIEKYVGGLPDMIHGSLMASKSKTMQDAIEFATELMDKKISTIAERQAENKRKFEDTSRNNQNQQQPFKRNNVAWSYTTGPGEKKPYGGKTPDANDVTGTFLLNNCYASILFDTGADRSFVSNAFSSLIDIIPSTLDRDYDVELADGKIIRINTIIRGCTLNFLNHPFKIDLIPVELGSFDIIIGMDWLSMYHAVIVYAEKIVRIPWGNETLIVRGDGSDNGHGSRLNIISCTKTQKYLLKGCHVFLAHVTTKEAKDKSKEKRLEEVPIVQDFPEVFPEDLQTRAPYQLAPSEMKELSDQLKELSDKGFIGPSSSPWGAPVLFVKKKDGSFWM
ncbi:putative reverse transcriptase domain-containing protein [Tanacetum coccineum]